MSIPASLQIIFYFTIISFPPILIFASTQHIAYLFFSILADGVIDSLSLSVISIILYILIFFIRCEFLVTAFGSFFYRSGNFITFSVYTIDIVFLSCACVLNGSYITLGEFKAQFTLSLFYFLAGFFYFFTGGYFFAMTNVMNALTQAYGISLLVSSILSFIDLYGQFPNNELSYIIIFWVAIISYCFFKLRQDSKDRRNTLILKNCHNFDDLPIRNSVELVSFFKAGLMTPLPFIYDGSFFIWGFLKYKNSWILMEIVRLSSLIPRCEKLDEIINDYFGAFTNENQNDRFILYEHYLIMGMRFYEAPETLMPKIKTAFKQIDQFRFISKNFSCSFSKDPPKVFLFSEGLAQISSRLYSYVKNMNQMYPNCPDVLRLMSQYYKKVENDSINYTLLNNQALSIERGYFGATDFHFVKIASAFPVAQRILYESMQKDAIQKAMAEEPSQQVHNSYISNKSNTLFIVTVTLFILFSISVLIDFFFNVGLITTHTKGIYTGYNMIYEYSKCSIIFSNFFYKSIEYLQSSLDEEYTIVDNLFSVFDDEILSLYEMFMFNTKNPLFQEHFMWFDENTYPITSLNMQKINAGFRSGLGRVSDIFTKLFDPKYQSSQDDIVFYYISSFDLLEGFFQIIDTFPFSFQKLCDQTQERDMQHLLYSMIPLIVFVLLFSAIPFFYRAELLSISKMFPVEDNSNTSTDKSLMKIFLQRNYLSFTTITVIYELILICIVACSVILYISTESLTKKHLNQTLNEGNISLRYGEAALIVSSSLTATILSSTNHLKADTVSLITSRTIKYFANHVFTQHNYSNSLYEFSMCFRSIVNDSNYAALIYDTTYINLMKNIYDSVLINSITISHEENAHLNYHIRIQMVSNIFAINLVILLIEIVLLVCIMKILNIIENCLKIYLKLLIDGTNTTASSLEKITQIIDSKTRNILDFINYPTSLVDRNGIIIYVNHYWIVNFKMKPEFIIGQNIDKFLEDIPENKVKIYPLPEMHSIYVIETSKEDIENEEKLNELINEVKHIRSSIIPKQFIDKEPGRYNVGLLIICSLIIEPVSFDELSSDDWSSDYETFLSYFYQQCDEFDDINIIQTSGRELTLLVGVSGKYISKYLTLKTLILISDTLRYIHESEWCGGGFSMCSVITCSHKSEFVIHCNKATTIDMFGSAFSKQMNLRKFIEPNSIIVCKNIINQIKGQECGFDFKKIQPGVYNFILNEPDDEEMNLELSKYPKPHMNSSYYY